MKYFNKINNSIVIFQESSTSRDTVQTVLKSASVQEFEASLRVRRGHDYSLPTPIRELDDMLQANTSAHTSRYKLLSID